MLNATGTLQWEFENVDRAHWPLRDGLKAAANTDDPNYVKYRDLANKFVLRKKDNSLVAELRNAPLPMQTATMVFNEVTDILGVIGAATEHKEADKLLFPNVLLADAEKIILDNFCVTTGYKMLIGNDGLTLSKVHSGTV